MNAHSNLVMDFAAKRFAPVAPKTDAIADQTYFTLFARWPNEVGLMTVEWSMIQTMAEALEAVKQNERTVLVFRNDPDVPRRDVSEDLARIWLKELWVHGFDPAEESVPAFIGEHLTDDEVARAE